MSASIISIAKTPALRNSKIEEKDRDVCVAEERILKFRDKGDRLSTYEREKLAFNLEKILTKYQLRSPKFKRSTLLKHISDILTKDDLEKETLAREVDQFDFSRWLNRVTLKEEKFNSNKELFSKVDRYILFTEAFLLETKQTPKAIFESLTLGTKFHHAFISELSFEEDKVIATRIYERLLHRIHLMDKQHGILQAYKEINELVIIANSNGGSNYWPLYDDDTPPSPNYYFYLSGLFEKKWLKENEIEDVLIQDADLNDFHPENQADILKACNEYIFEPKKNYQELTKPMGAYYFCKNYFDFNYIKDIPYFHLGGSLLTLNSKKATYTWGEYKALTDYSQREIDKPNVDNWELPWAYIVLYPNLDSKEITPLYIEPYGDTAYFDILDIEKITELLHSQFAQPNKKWKKNDVLPEFWELILADDGVYFESIFQSFEETITNLKNHPLLIQAKNIKSMADKFTERFNEEKLRE